MPSVLQLVQWIALALLAVGVNAQEDVYDATTVRKCRNPTRRQEWRTLSKSQKADWLRAVKCLNDLPHTSKLTPTVFPTDIPPVNTSSSYWDDLVYVHMDLNNRIHQTGQFLPWHRWYMHVVETDLKTKCGYKGAAPYWDWTKDTAGETAAIWKDGDRKSGLGGWGDPNNDYALTDGALAGFKLTYPNPHTLRRQWLPQPYLPMGSPAFAVDQFKKSDVNRAVNGHKGNFKAFQTDVEALVGMHSSIHLMMGGDLGGICPEGAPANCVAPSSTFSPNEPMFFLHHGMIDKIWWQWQQKNIFNAVAFSGGSVAPNLFNTTDYELFPTGKAPMMNLLTKIPANGMFPEVRVGDVMNTQGEFLCYVYV